MSVLQKKGQPRGLPLQITITILFLFRLLAANDLALGRSLLLDGLLDLFRGRFLDGFFAWLRAAAFFLAGLAFSTAWPFLTAFFGLAAALAMHVFLISACAAARRAMGTRKGEQET